MGLKQKISNFISYLSSDEIDDSIESDEVEYDVENDKPKTENRVSNTRVEVKQRETQQTREVTSGQSHQVKQNVMMNRENRTEMPNQTTIALKFPKKYEDAREIVDLLSNNECVLIDFQYMLDAQARRCIDFIDGASKVLDGNLRKIGGSMFLLTPPNIIVDIEELASVNPNQDFGFDFDMKAR